MKPIYQTEFGSKGNCLQASIASVLDLKLNQIPNIANCDEEVSDIEWPLFLQEVMNELGYVMTVTVFDGTQDSAIKISRMSKDTEGYFVTVGSNKNRTAMHSNVWNYNGLVFDPYSVDGIDGRYISSYKIAYVFTKMPQAKTNESFQYNLNLHKK